MAFPESQKTKELREKLEAVVYTDKEKFVDAIAKRHTILNLGQNWPEVQHLEQLAEDDEMYKGVMQEYRSWKKDAKKEVTMITKAKLPWTLANAELAFHRKGPFEGVPR